MAQRERIVRSCPAKVNLCLLIRGRRSDGYHLLESLFVPVSLCDELILQVEPASVAEVKLEASPSENLPVDDSNLACVAARALLQECAAPMRVLISLEKHIPIGSGLGGASSDAAAILRALNRIVTRPLSPHKLHRLARTIGSDVPFFLMRGAAIVRGTGEDITPVTLPSRLHLVLCSDGTPLATQSVYSQVDLALTSGNRPSNIERFISGKAPLSELLHNDLERPAAKLHRGIQAAKATLLEFGASGALMTGSGSAVFGVFENERFAESAAASLRELGYWAVSVQSLNE